jgi:DNA-binding CsgD family transcriptional regulator
MGEVIGRAAELQAIDAFLEDARDGPAGLILHGDAGIGKTALWAEALERARGSSFRVLRSAPAESEQALALGGLTDLFSTVSEAELALLPEVQRHALEIALVRAEPEGQLPDQRTLSVATAAVLRTLAAAGPLLVTIDDAQWLDDSSAAILAYALRRVTDRGAAVLLAVRGSPMPATLALVAEAAPERRRRIEIGPMPLAALHQLFLERLGRSFPRLTLVRIEGISAGNPFYALEIARAVDPHAAVVNQGERLPIPESLGALVGVRIAALPEATRAALLLAAAAAEPTLETLGRADPAARKALDAAIDQGIVSIEAGTVRFAHPLLAEAVIASADAATLRAAHRVLAGAASSPAARARHLGGAAEGPDETVAGALAAAAMDARDRGATLDAAALFDQASRLTPRAEPERSVRRAIAAAECLFIDISEIVQAAAILEAAIAAAPAGPARAEALSLRAIIRYYHGHAPEALRLGELALAEAGEDPLLRAMILGRLAFLTMQLDLERGHALAEEAVGLLEHELGPVDPDLFANVLLLDASAELGLVRGLRRDEIERGTRLISVAGRSWEREGADGIAFGIARLTDDLDRAIAMTHELIRSKSGPSGDDPFNLVQLSGLQLLHGEWPAARVSAEAALDGYAREGADVYPSWGLRGIALVEAHEGRLEDATRHATEGLERATGNGDLVLETMHRHILGFIALSLGDHRAADAQLTAAATSAEASGVRHPGRFKLEGDRVEAALALGDLARTGTIVEALAHAARVAPTPWTVAVGARARGLLLAATGDLDGAQAALDEAMAAHDALAMPFERARSLLAKGRIHRRRKQKGLADQALREARAVFEGLGAPRWSDRARDELARVGLRPHVSDELTDTERRVAELAASGLSSRQIGEVAFLAPKTVGNVLGRVYEKLGIHSRAELGARMAQDPMGDRSG